MNMLETKRLFFKSYEKENKTDFIELFTDEFVMKQVDKGVSSRAYAEKVWRKIHEDFYPRGIKTIWAVLSKENSEYVGHAIIIPMILKEDKWEIGFILKRGSWRKGYGTEISKKLVEHSFESLGLKKVYATVDDDNPGAIKVLINAGMIFEKFDFDEQGRFSVYSVSQNTKQQTLDF